MLDALNLVFCFDFVVIYCLLFVGVLSCLDASYPLWWWFVCARLFSLCYRLWVCLVLVWFVVAWVAVLALFCCAFDLLIVFVFWVLIWLYCRGIVNSVV